MRARLAILLGLVAIAAGCGERSEPIGALPVFPQTATDALIREVDVTEAPKRIVSLDPGLTDAAFQIGAGPLVVGGTGDETRPTQATRLPSMLDDSGVPDIKAIRKKAPDLVVVPSGMVTTKADADQLANKIGANVYVSDDTSVNAIEHDILQLGLMTGHSGEARGVYSDMQRRIDAITSQFKGQPAVPVFIDRGYRYTIPPDGLAADLVKLAGGENVAGAADPNTPVSPADLRTAAPQVYIAQAGTGVTLEGLRRSPATRTIPAIQQRNFAIIPESVLEATGPEVVHSLETLARDIHPDLAPSNSP
jgi:cobalamin transport system substrate-binding protein